MLCTLAYALTNQGSYNELVCHEHLGVGTLAVSLHLFAGLLP